MQKLNNMDSKEKARELVNKYKDYVHGYVGSSMLSNTEFQDVILSNAKKLVIEFVNEIIDTSMTGYLINDSKVAEFQVKMRDYWVEVKKEIEKIDSFNQ